ncbi:MAG: GTP-binding protein [Candidatus Eremiobacteraeota bacterium]|nr:GTP-binding protein [Candidatus Eremiobacteraeota bacterium]
MKRKTLKIIIIGHVDHGKSTLIGRLLLDTNSLPKETVAELKKISRELGRDTELAYLTDQLKEEREQRITIDTTQIFFKTPKRDYVIIDVPGHVEFLKNMISGATLAEVAVLIVDTNEGIMEQTRRHAYIIKLLGIERVIVLFNKMDLVGYDRARFEAVRRELLQFLENLAIVNPIAIPVSAWKGDNISKPSRAMAWYEGLPFLAALESVESGEKKAGRYFRFPVQDVYERLGERVMVGRIASGTVREGDRVLRLPEGTAAMVKKIAVYPATKPSADEGESVGIIAPEAPGAKRGDVLGDINDPPLVTTSFTGNVFWMSQEPLEADKPVTLLLATQEATCRPISIEKRINSSTLEVIEEHARKLEMNEAAIVKFAAESPLVVELFSHVEELGRFVIEKDYTVMGAGIVTAIDAQGHPRAR